MAGTKETYQVDLNPDQMAFVRSVKDKFSLADEGKTIRIVLDYLMTQPQCPRHRVHPATVPEVRVAVRLPARPYCICWTASRAMR